MSFSRGLCIGVEVQSTLGGTTFFLKNMYQKLTQCPNFTYLCRKIIKNTRIFSIFAQKINKIPEFYMILPEKCPNFHNNCPKNIFPDFFWGGGARTPSAPRLLLLWDSVYETNHHRRRSCEGPRVRTLAKIVLSGSTMCWTFIKI